MRLIARSLPLALLVLALPGATLLWAQEEPLVAGSDGVPVPKKLKHVQPIYPPEAIAQGIRGIVILDLVLDTEGRVESTSVIRSIPGLDQAALAAARQWQYEPVKVNGKPVRVRMTVPITFALALPRLERQEGVPELRQGVGPHSPSGEKGKARATANVTLEPDGRIGLARLIEGEAPWSEALIAALKTWRFAAPPEDAVLSFRVEADFVPGRGRDADQVSLRATGLQRSDLLAGPGPESEATAAAPEAEAPEPSSAGAPAAGKTEAEAPAPAPSQPSTTPAPPAEPPATTATTGTASEPAREAPAPAPPIAEPAAAPAAPAATSGSSETAPGAAAPPGTATPPGAPPSPTQAPPGPVAPPSPQAEGAAAAAPPVEVITAPPPPPPPENGVSAIRDVTLEPGVPDLVRGRRPVAPPFARMAGVDGTVEVEFSVSAAGTTTVRSVSGPDLLKPAAQDAIASWVFRRTRADRAYLVAVVVYAADKATAVVRPEAVPGTPPAPAPGSEPAVPSPSPPPPMAPAPRP
jgi:TonB family protein